MAEGKLPRWQARMRVVSHRVTWQLGRRWPKTFPFVFVLGYPKSGTTWACQLLADYLQLPFPRYSLLPVGCPAVVHGHERVDTKYPRGVYSMRDGRDVFVSRYFFRLRHVADGPSPSLPRDLREIFGDMKDKSDIATYLPRMIEYSARTESQPDNWAAHLRSFYDYKEHSFVPLRYEDLLADGPGALMTAASALTGDEPDPERARMAVEKFDFSRQKKQRTGAQGGKKFLRKGRAGDWRNHFTKEIAELFDRHFGEMLVAAGYEQDRSWVDTVGAEAPGDREPERAAV